MICENCGTIIQDPFQTFCPSCGISLTRILEYNGERKDFEEVERKQPLYTMLSPDIIHLFIDHAHKKVWIRHGSRTPTRMKFIVAKLAHTIRDRYAINYNLAAVDEGYEPLEFKRMIGLEEESENTDEQSVLTYTAEELVLFERLTREKKQLLLEKAKEKGILPSIKPSKKDLKNNLYCKFCGSKHTKGQKICPVCGKMGI